MYMCMHICVYIYTHIHVYVYTHTQTMTAKCPMRKKIIKQINHLKREIFFRKEKATGFCNCSHNAL